MKALEKARPRYAVVRRSLVLSVALVIAALQAAPVHAVMVGTYALSNQPEFGVPLPDSGLRLDGLLSGDGEETYLFDFEAPQSDMRLSFNGSTLHIFGTAFGGEHAQAFTSANNNNTTRGGIDNNNDGYVDGTTAVWTIDFSYTLGVSQSSDGGNFDDVTVNTIPSSSNTGFMSSVLGSYDMVGRDDGNNTLSFQFGDAINGHAGSNGISGWGWLDTCPSGGNGCNLSGEYFQDWRFRATLIPVPAAAWLFGSALVGLVMSRRLGRG